MNRRSLVTTALVVGLLVTGCNQAPDPKDEAESYVIKACGIELNTSDSGDTEKYVYEESDGTKWSLQDSLTALEERETSIQAGAQNAAQANRLDPYWNGLADAAQRMYSFVHRLVQARKDFNVYLGWNGKDWPQKTAYEFEPDSLFELIPTGVEDVPESDFTYRESWLFSGIEDYNDATGIVRVTCGSLANSLNAD